LNIILKLILIIFLTSNIFANNQKKERKYNLVFGVAKKSSVLTKFEDANVAIKIWLDDIGSLYDADIDMFFYDNTAKLYEHFNENKVNVALFDLPYFFKYRKKIDLSKDTNWSILIDNEKFTHYYLIGKNDKKFNGFNDFKNKILSIKRDDEIAKIWLNKKSYEINKKKASKVLKLVKEESKDRTVLFNVFFGKADYAVIREKAWETIVSFNPAIKKRVKIIEKSNVKFLPFLGVVNKNTPSKAAKLFFQESVNLSKLEGGNKVLKALKFNRIYQLADEDLVELDKYYNDYFRLEKKYK